MPVPKLTMFKGVKKSFSGSDRRRWPRRNLSDIPSLKSVILNQSTGIHVIDISRGGILLETEMQLRPQMKILLKIVTSKDVIKIPGCVLRSSIASLTGKLRYQSAIAFEQPLDILDDLKDKPSNELQDAVSICVGPATLQENSGQSNESPAILTVIANGQADL